MVTLNLIAIVAIIVVVMDRKSVVVSLNDMDIFVVDAAMISISDMLFVYVGFISNKSNYTYLTIASEVLNLVRVYPPALAMKVVIDMHREYMKVCL